jgi:hypothetical protein
MKQLHFESNPVSKPMAKLMQLENDIIMFNIIDDGWIVVMRALRC